MEQWSLPRQTYNESICRLKSNLYLYKSDSNKSWKSIKQKIWFSKTVKIRTIFTRIVLCFDTYSQLREEMATSRTFLHNRTKCSITADVFAARTRKLFTTCSCTMECWQSRWIEYSLLVVPASCGMVNKKEEIIKNICLSWIKSVGQDAAHAEKFLRWDVKSNYWITVSL